MQIRMDMKGTLLFLFIFIPSIAGANPLAATSVRHLFHNQCIGVGGLRMGPLCVCTNTGAKSIRQANVLKMIHPFTESCPGKPAMEEGRMCQVFTKGHALAAKASTEEMLTLRLLYKMGLLNLNFIGLLQTQPLSAVIASKQQQIRELLKQVLNPKATAKQELVNFAGEVKTNIIGQLKGDVKSMAKNIFVPSEIQRLFEEVKSTANQLGVDKDLALKLKEDAEKLKGKKVSSALANPKELSKKAAHLAMTGGWTLTKGFAKGGFWGVAFAVSAEASDAFLGVDIRELDPVEQVMRMATGSSAFGTWEDYYQKYPLDILYIDSQWFNTKQACNLLTADPTLRNTITSASLALEFIRQIKNETDLPRLELVSTEAGSTANCTQCSTSFSSIAAP